MMSEVRQKGDLFRQAFFYCNLLLKPSLDLDYIVLIIVPAILRLWRESISLKWKNHGIKKLFIRDQLSRSAMIVELCRGKGIRC